jgi:hypothetical protein
MVKIKIIGANDKKLHVQVSTGVFSDKEVYVTPKTAHKILQYATIDVPIEQLQEAAMVGEREGDKEFVETVKGLLAKRR